MGAVQVRSLDQADETRSFPNGVVEMVTIADTMIGRARFEPGWRWSNDGKPAGTDWCMVLHEGYRVSGTAIVQAEDQRRGMNRPARSGAGPQPPTGPAHLEPRDARRSARRSARSLATVWCGLGWLAARPVAPDRSRGAWLSWSGSSQADSRRRGSRAGAWVTSLRMARRDRRSPERTTRRRRPRPAGVPGRPGWGGVPAAG